MTNEKDLSLSLRLSLCVGFTTCMAVSKATFRAGTACTVVHRIQSRDDDYVMNTTRRNPTTRTTALLFSISGTGSFICSVA